MSLADSYRASYNAENMNDNSIRVNACRLMAKPNVTLMAERIQKEAERAVVALSVSDKDTVLNHLRKWIIGNEDATTAQLRSADMLGRSCGLFKDVIETVVQRSPEDVQAELTERLTALQKKYNKQSDTADSVVH